jgi:hypothetical protein
MPKITDELCDRIWAIYQRNPSYTETAKQVGHDARTVKKCVQKKKAELERHQQQAEFMEEKRIDREREEVRQRRTEAFKMLKEGKRLEDVAIHLGDHEEAKVLFSGWLSVTRRQALVDIYLKVGEAGLRKLLQLNNQLEGRKVDSEEVLKFMDEHKKLEPEIEALKKIINSKEERITLLIQENERRDRDMVVMEELIVALAAGYEGFGKSVLLATRDMAKFIDDHPRLKLKLYYLIKRWH